MTSRKRWMIGGIIVGSMLAISMGGVGYMWFWRRHQVVRMLRYQAPLSRSIITMPSKEDWRAKIWIDGQRVDDNYGRIMIDARDVVEIEVECRTPDGRCFGSPELTFVHGTDSYLIGHGPGAHGIGATLRDVKGSRVCGYYSVSGNTHPYWLNGLSSCQMRLQIKLPVLSNSGHYNSVSKQVRWTLLKKRYVVFDRVVNVRLKN